MLSPAERDSLLEQARTLHAAVNYPPLVALLEPLPMSDLVAAPELGVFLATALRFTGAARRCIPLCDALEAPCRALGNHSVFRRYLIAHGAALWEMGEMARAEQLFLEALEASAAAGDERLQFLVCNNLGTIASLRCRYDDALAAFSRAITHQQRLGLLRHLAESFGNVGVVLRELGYYAEADKRFLKSAAYARAAGAEHSLIVVEIERAYLAYLMGDVRLADAAAKRALEHATRFGDPIWESEALRVAGVTARAAGRLDESGTRIDQALALSRRTRSTWQEAEALEERGVLQAMLGDERAAAADATASGELYERLGSPARADRAREYVADAIAGRSGGVLPLRPAIGSSA